MGKKLMTACLSLVILLFSSNITYSEDYMTGTFFYRNVVVNGTDIVNYNLQYPFFIYNDNMYIPLSEDIGNVFGFTLNADKDRNVVEVIKTDSTKENLTNNWTKNQGQDIALKVWQDVEVRFLEETIDKISKDMVVHTVGGNIDEFLDWEREHAYDSQIEPEENVSNEDNSQIKVEKNEINQDNSRTDFIIEEIDLGNLPVLTKGSYVFLPIKAFKNSEIFKWGTYFNQDFGVCISTETGVNPESFYREAEAIYNKGLTEYILKYNKIISPYEANKLVFYFKRAAKVNNIDEKIIMAMAHRESTFNHGAISRGGARGMMQLMPRTGSSFGMTLEQMLDAKLSINAGASLVRAGLDRFGTIEKSLSSYNQGSSRVAKGRYSTRYANKILGTYNKMQEFLKVNGYL